MSHCFECVLRLLAVAWLVCVDGRKNKDVCTVACGMDFIELKHSITPLVCPPGCLNQRGSLCGKKFYNKGPICMAAIQEQLIDNGGGPVVVYRSSIGDKNYQSLVENKEKCSTTSDGTFYSFEMTCVTQGDSASTVNHVICPRGCGGEAVNGSDKHNVTSSVCKAAIRDGVLTEQGGPVSFYVIKEVTSHSGSTSGGVASRQKETYFTFKYTDSCETKQCENNSTCVSLITEYLCICSPGFTGAYCETELTCWGNHLTGIFELKIGAAVCDEGWLVFQRRFDGSENFQRNWTDYKDGFGNLTGEFWWGLEKIHETTRKSKHCRLHIDLLDCENESANGSYRPFRVGSEGSKYELWAGEFSGSIGDRLIGKEVNYNDGVPFSTRDWNNHGAVNCTNASRGGWWFDGCSFTEPNAPWRDNCTFHGVASEKGIRWATWRDGRTIRKITFKFRCDG